LKILLISPAKTLQRRSYVWCIRQFISETTGTFLGCKSLNGPLEYEISTWVLTVAKVVPSRPSSVLPTIQSHLLSSSEDFDSSLTNARTSSNLLWKSLFSAL
jgi:hypothetical protein